MLDKRTLEQPTGEVGRGFDEYLFYLLTHVANRRSRDFSPELAAIGLSLAEWRALAVINRLEGCLMTELSDFTTVDRTTLTRTLDRLVAADIVCRSASPQDRRQVTVRLTDKGRAALDLAVEALKGHNARALKGLSEDDLTTLRSLLQRILRNIVQDPEHFLRVLMFER